MSARGIPLLWGADPMLNQVHDYLGFVPLERITAMKATPGRKWQQLSIALDGGQEIQLEARGARHALVAAYERGTRPEQLDLPTG